MPLITRFRLVTSESMDIAIRDLSSNEACV